jgi:hypothetical protein
MFSEERTDHRRDQQHRRAAAVPGCRVFTCMPLKPGSSTVRPVCERICTIFLPLLKGSNSGADRARWMGGRERATRSLASSRGESQSSRRLPSGAPSFRVPPVPPPSGEAVNPHRGVREAGVASSAKNLPSVGGAQGPGVLGSLWSQSRGSLPAFCWWAPKYRL